MSVTLNIGSQNIKVVASKGSVIEKWETVPLPPGVIKDGLILQPQAVASAINSLFDRLQLPRDRVIASIAGVSFTYRILMLPRMKPALQQEAIQRATQKEINVSLDELYIDWQIFSDTGKEIGVFVLGISRVVIDAVIQTMYLAKVKLTAVDITSLALARAIGQTNALIINFEPDWFDITIISKGIPVTLHSVASKSQTASLEDNVRQLVEELNRTVDFYNLTHKEISILPSTPITMAGTLAGDALTQELILKNIGHPVQSIMAQIKLPPNFPVSSYEVNLGLILKHAHRNTFLKRNVDSYFDINLNPLSGRQRVLAHPVSIRKLLIPAAIIIAVLMLIPVYMLKNTAVSDTIKLQTELDRVNHNLYIGRLTLDRATSTETVISALTAEIDKLQKEQELISGRGELAAVLKSINDALPVGADYTAIFSDTTKVIIDGYARNRMDIINYARALEKQANFTEVRIALIDEASPDNETEIGPPLVTFRIAVER